MKMKRKHVGVPEPISPWKDKSQRIQGLRNRERKHALQKRNAAMEIHFACGAELLRRRIEDPSLLEFEKEQCQKYIRHIKHCLTRLYNGEYDGEDFPEDFELLQSDDVFQRLIKISQGPLVH